MPLLAKLEEELIGLGCIFTKCESIISHLVFILLSMRAEI